MIDFARSHATSHAAPAPPTSPHPRADLERLGDKIAELAAHIDVATYRLLVLIREFDQREGWDGTFKTCAHWLSWRTGIAIGPAREKLRVAHAIEHLPLMSARMQRGELSYSKARALTRVATPENEEALLEFAHCGTASHVESLVRAWRRVDRAEDEWQERERHRTRELSVFPDEDGMYVIRGRLDPEVGAVLMRAIEAGVEALYGRSRGNAGAEAEGAVAAAEPMTGPQQRADALGLLAERAVQSGLEEKGEAIGRADRFQVVVHVDAEALADSSELESGSGSGWTSESPLPPPKCGGALLDGLVRVPAGTSRRLACDATRVKMTHGADGSVLDVGRKTRTVPPAIRRALDHRDGCCRFPGCANRFCDAHHIKHWADGGETRLDNLVLLCRRHHRAVHEEGFRVEMVRAAGGGGKRRPCFYWPDGQSFPTVPPAPRPPADPVAALEAEHSGLKIHVGPETATPHWKGERFDVGWAIHTLWRA